MNQLQKANNLRLTIKGFLISALMIGTWVCGIEAASAFKYTLLPSEKCVMKRVAEENTELGCINLTVLPPQPSPTNPGDPRNQQQKKIPTSVSEMQKVLDWCNKQGGNWTSDGRNGGTCHLRSR